MFKRLCLMVVLSLSMAHAGGVDSSVSLIKTLNKEMLRIVKSDTMKKQEKLEKLSLIVIKNVDIAYVQRAILGRYWRVLDSKEKRDYTYMFKNWIGNTIATKILDFGIRDMLQISKAYTRNSYVVVRTKKAQPVNNDETVLDTLFVIDWYIKDVKGFPKIRDIFVSNVSLILTKRSEFMGIYKRAGIWGIIRNMEEQIADTAY